MDTETTRSDKEINMRYCPKCRTEYRDGFEMCADCGEKLTSFLPPEKKEEINPVEFKEVYMTYNPADIAFVSSLLDADKIIYYVENENVVHVYPLALPARFMVNEKQYDEAKEILKDYNGRFSGLNLYKESIDIDTEEEKNKTGYEKPVPEYQATDDVAKENEEADAKTDDMFSRISAIIITLVTCIAAIWAIDFLFNIFSK